MKRSFLLAALLLSTLTTLPSCIQIGSTASNDPEQSESSPDGATVLRLLYARTPTTLNPHLANGFQDFEAARIIYEPLATYQTDGRMVPILAALVPTPENGGISADGRTVTWKLKPDVRWSDGQPFTAEDVVFTYDFVSNPLMASVTEKYYEAIEKVEAVDPLTVKITFKAPNPSWALAFTGQNGMILPKHIFSEAQGPNARQTAASLLPVGTGPYRFITINDERWTFGANEQFREGSPSFDIVELEGDVTPYVAARRVLQDGSADFVHNLQLSIDDRVELSTGGTGRIVATFGSYVERIMLNPTDPNKITKTGERASTENPHPFLSDVTVRKAIDYGINRAAIANEVYGNAGQQTNQLLPFPTKYANPALAHQYNPNLANQLLDQAGWVDSNNNGIRDKDGVEMRVVFQTPINAVRQQTQLIVKEDLQKIGIDVSLRRVTVDDFFSADPRQTRSINHFYADMQEYNAGSDTPDPTIYMSWWLCDEIATRENNWQKPNNARYCNEEYDKVWQQASKELNPEKRAKLFQQLNTILMNDVAVIPLVRRAVTNGISDRITGVDPTPWDASTWDIGTWQLSDPPEGSNTEGSNAKGSDAKGSGAEGSDAEGSDAKGSDVEGSGAEGLDTENSEPKEIESEATPGVSDVENSDESVKETETTEPNSPKEENDTTEETSSDS